MKAYLLPLRNEFGDLLAGVELYVIASDPQEAKALDHFLAFVPPEGLAAARIASPLAVAIFAETFTHPAGPGGSPAPPTEVSPREARQMSGIVISPHRSEIPA